MVSHYRITEKLGKGGMGVVYKAQDTRLDRVVALKFLPADSIAEADRQRFIGEAQAAARVHHPNICPIYEISEHEGQLFFAMAFVQGKTVTQLVRDGNMQTDTALDIAIQVASGLEAAHRQGVVHRDIKGANIAVDAEGHAWILDFGIALRQESERITAAGNMVGTPAFMSPEQAQGLKVDRRTDIWSLGVLLFEMLTGQLPFRRKSDYSTIVAIVTEEVPPLSGLRPDLLPGIEQFLRKSLAKNPDERWQSAAEAAVELRRIRETLSIHAVPPPGQFHTAETADTEAVTIPPITKPQRPRRIYILAGLIAMVIAAGYFAVRMFWPGSGTLPDEKRIAVLPLAVMGNDETVRALADGLVETLTSKLTQIEEFQGRLMVVPASEIRSRGIASAEAARRVYGANVAITGSAQRWGDRIQFTLNLVDTATVRQFASKTFDFDAGNPIALRDGAVNGAVRLLSLKLSPASTISMAAGETFTPGAYAEYLKGIGYLARYDLSGNVDRAIESLKDATRLDAKYALAFAALGEAHWRKAKVESNKRESELALESIREAIRLDPRLVEARVKLGRIYGETGQTREAIEEVLAALKVSPENAEAYRVLGVTYAAAGRFSEAEAAYKEAVKRKPNDWYGNLLLGIFYFDRGRDIDARVAFEAARKLTPDNEVVYRNIANVDMREGKFRQASDMISKTLQFEPSAKTYSTLGIAYYYQRRFQEAADAVNAGITINPGLYRSWGNLGTFYRHLPGNEQRAEQAFRKAIELANKSLEVMNPDYTTRANLAEYLAKLGDGKKAMEEIDLIPAAIRRQFADRIVLAYELTGDRKRAVDTVKSLAPIDPVLTFIKNDPDLESLWRDPALR